MPRRTPWRALSQTRAAAVSLSGGFVSTTVRLLSRTEAEPEGFVIENLRVVVPDRSVASFYRTSAVAEIDLLTCSPAARQARPFGY